MISYQESRKNKKLGDYIAEEDKDRPRDNDKRGED